MTSSAPSLRELTATVPLGADDEATTRRWAKERWAEMHERAKKLAEDNEARRASLPPPPPPSSRSPQRAPLHRRRFASESTREALQIMRRNLSSAPPAPDEERPALSRRWIVFCVLVLAVDVALVLGSLLVRYGWPV